MPRLEEDRKLLDGFRRGEAEALRAVYREYAARIALFLRGEGRGPRLTATFELENGLQEVFLRAFESGARQAYDGLRPYEGFLVGIARNVLHERAREREVPAADPEAKQPADPADAEADVEDREVARLLQDFLGACTADERALYDLRFEQGLSQEEAATRLSTTRIQLRRRERKLKLRLLGYMQSRGYLAGVQAKGWGFGSSTS